ncbi:hypothetical protein GCM10025864_36970 [Luteimicrobium album]|uniref:Uncharacterized protein n=1 Tax=Luteimicrobium album TaxID=1054550 RepID=A0ABQ6I716_9MICO|nr:hypothetical protein GCM10025864_36970 [Luteimicrobium album]
MRAYERVVRPEQLLRDQRERGSGIVEKTTSRARQGLATPDAPEAGRDVVRARPDDGRQLVLDVRPERLGARGEELGIAGAAAVGELVEQRGPHGAGEAVAGDPARPAAQRGPVLIAPEGAQCLPGLVEGEIANRAAARSSMPSESCHDQFVKSRTFPIM